VRTWRWWVGGLVLLALCGGRTTGATRSADPSTKPLHNAVYEDVAYDKSFVYGAAARFNERLLGTIDAIDTALTAILAGDVAVVIFTIDKMAVFEPQKEVTAVVLLGGSILACAVGYIFGFRPHGSNPDGVRPRIFIADLSASRDESMLGAIEELVAAGEINLTIRFVKRMLAICAIMLLLAGVVVVALARSGAW
jgi:hypothetical protein